MSEVWGVRLLTYGEDVFPINQAIKPKLDGEARSHFNQTDKQ